MLPFQEKKYQDQVPQADGWILVGDIGGTNSNFGIFALHGGRATLFVSLHMKSRTITDFASVVADLLSSIKNTYHISITHACFAAAGVASKTRDYCKPTNLTFEIRSKDIIQKTSLVCAAIVNDFEVIGHGLSHVAPTDIVSINKGRHYAHAPRVILGAGTGLGKSILLWDTLRMRYMPLVSEGGHADCAVQHHIELEMIQFIRHHEQLTTSISWEDVLSGKGIQRIYSFFTHRNNHVYADGDLVRNGVQPDEIFNNRVRDEHSKNTCALYTQLYARCAKNLALDALALGGVYIAGGIAAKNVELFRQGLFAEEFISCAKQRELLKQVPIYIITDYAISLYGAAEYMILEGLCG